MKKMKFNEYLEKICIFLKKMDELNNDWIMCDFERIAFGMNTFVGLMCGWNYMWGRKKMQILKIVWMLGNFWFYNDDYELFIILILSLVLRRKENYLDPGVMRSWFSF